MPVARSVRSVTNVEGQNFSVSVQQPVLYPVASPVPFVLNVRGQSQKKDGSPSSKVKQEINFVKGVFYCVNTSYTMDKCLSGRRRPARQTSEKDVLCFHRLAGP